MGTGAYRSLCACLVVLLAVGGGRVLAWKPADGPLKTRWTDEVSPEKALPEYPRPQMVRNRWTNLNGLWQYAIRPKSEVETPTKWDGEILVPFCVESALSGVKKPATPEERLWYRRAFPSSALAGQKRLLLHFGAVDWECTAWVNGKEVGHHTGGYDPFTFDVTDALKPTAGENELIVAVTDPTNTGTQPRGKQVLSPKGIFYTAVTGIWQTVWLEPVPKAYISSLKIAPDIDRELVTITAEGADERFRVTVYEPELQGKLMSTTKIGKRDAPVEVPIPNPHLWSPDDPKCYAVEVELLDPDNATTDRVSSYFGMRKIEVKKDADGLNRLCLNNKVLFEYGPLDQGWWPDGLYTAPTDAALKYDIEMTKRFGMNMIRKHVKVEPARWYYWCDQLGVLVWQDMPSGDVDKSAEGKANYRKELKSLIDGLRNVPSIVMWVPFNEGWGQHDTAEVVDWIAHYDPTRVVNEASGWTDKGSGDVADMHNYPGPGMREPESKRVCVLGEFGGLGMPVSGHTWQAEKNWGYVSFDSADKLTDAYVDLLTMMRPLIGQGLSAAVYTQTTDVEVEVNGLMTYDRERVKMNEARMVEAAKKLFETPPKMTVLAATSETKPQTWRYIMTKPKSHWAEAGFDDSKWRSGPGGFGTEETPRAVVRSGWDTSDIWLRRTFKIDSLPENGQLMLTAHHDDDAEVYLNGRLVRSLAGFTRHYVPSWLDDESRNALHVGENTIAVHCHQTTGGQYIDVGLSDVIKAKPPRP